MARRLLRPRARPWAILVIGTLSSILATAQTSTAQTSTAQTSTAQTSTATIEATSGEVPTDFSVGAGATASVGAGRETAYRPPGGRTPVVEPGNGTKLPRGAPNPYGRSGLGEFEAQCELSHRAAHDPIVDPGNPTFRHLHDFFGNRSTDHLSTLTSLRNQGSSCAPAVDRSAYWVPTLLNYGVPVTPDEIQVYYQVRAPQDPTKVRTMPEGLRIVAGDASAMSPQTDHAVQWQCFHSTQIWTTVPSCGSDLLQMLIEFPDCWDGASLDSVNHQSHMAYSLGHDCPATHPVLVPQLSFRVRYSVSGPGISLSSDSMPDHTMPGGTTAHGDFINAWVPDEFNRRVIACLNAARVCNAAGDVIR